MSNAAADWPPPGAVVTFGMWDFRLGTPRFVGIGVVDGPPEPHPHLDLWRLPVRPLDARGGPVPDWITRSDIIDVVPPRD